MRYYNLCYFIRITYLSSTCIIFGIEINVTHTSPPTGRLDSLPGCGGGKVFLIRTNNSLSLLLRPISKKTVTEKPEDRETSSMTTTPKLPSASIKPVRVQGFIKLFFTFIIVLLYFKLLLINNINKLLQR